MKRFIDWLFSSDDPLEEWMNEQIKKSFSEMKCNEIRNKRKSKPKWLFQSLN